MLSLISVVFGGVFTIAAAYALGCLLAGRNSVSHTSRLAAGSAVLSFVIYFLRLTGFAQWPELLTAGVLCFSGFAVQRPKFHRVIAAPPLVLAILAIFTIVYAIYALAPEIQSDPNVYHLKPAVDAQSTGGFSQEITFYDRLPQALENLFAMAYAFGGSSSAKLVHFAYLLATIPLLMSVLGRIGVSREFAAIAAAMYFCTPVVAVDGTAAFNDAALVFFTLAAMDLVLAGHPALGGISAGFCYAIKMTGGIVPVSALLYILWRRQWRAAAVFTAAATVMIAPWIIRNTIDVGNPFAPVLNAWFPNPYFTISLEQSLVAWFRHYDLTSAWQLPLELTIYGRKLQGMLGPAFLLAPLALLALRSKVGRILVAVAIVLSIPWALNLGTRFLMPAIPFLAAAMIFSLPRALATTLLLFHAVTAFPASIDFYSRDGWHLNGFPYRAALRIESEDDYMRRVSWDYNIARMIESHTRPHDRIFDLHGVQAALVHRTIVSDWQSTAGERLVSALRVGKDLTPGVFCEARAEVPAAAYRRIRIRQVGTARNWNVQEIELWNGAARVPSGRNWSLSSWPNDWDAPYAFDGNWISGWSAWQAARPGMYLEAAFDRTTALTAVNVVGLCDDWGSTVEIYVERTGGAWTKVDTKATKNAGINLRRNATKFLWRSGIRYLLVPTGVGGNGSLGVALIENPGDWGVEKTANFEQIYLLKIQEPGR